MQTNPEIIVNSSILLGDEESAAGLRPEHFTGTGRVFFERAQKLLKSGNPITPWDIDPPEKPTPGLAQYITVLHDTIPVQVGEAVAELRERARVKSMREILASHIRRLDMLDPVDEIAGSATSSIEALLRGDQEGGGVHHITDAGKMALSAVSGYEGGDHGAVLTGISSYDQKYGGFLPHELIVLAGAGGMGKTSLAMRIAGHIARDRSVLAVNCEMGEPALAARHISAALGIPGGVWRSADMWPETFENISKYLAESENLKLWLKRGISLSPSSLLRIARRHKAKHGLGLLVVDYYQRMVPDSKGLTREQQLSEISRELKEMTAKINCPILLLAATNRDIKHRENKRPLISDIRECGQLEFDADSISFVYRDSYYRQDSSSVAEWITRKHRSGPENYAIKMLFEPEYTRFSDMELDTVDHKTKSSGDW